jgi:hypothetical protein
LKIVFYLCKIKSFEYPCSPNRPCGLARHDIVSTTGGRSSGCCRVCQIAPCSGVTVPHCRLWSGAPHECEGFVISEQQYKRAIGSEL